MEREQFMQQLREFVRECFRINGDFLRDAYRTGDEAWARKTERMIVVQANLAGRALR